MVAWMDAFLSVSWCVSFETRNHP